MIYAIAQSGFWEHFPWGAALTIVGMAIAVILLAMDERNRRKFAPREGLFDNNGKLLVATLDDLNHWGRKVDAHERLFLSMQERWDGVARQVERIVATHEIQQEHVMQRLGDTAQALRDVAARMESMASAQVEHSTILKGLIEERREQRRQP